MSIISKDTIAALATAPLSAGVAVIRLSGSSSRVILESLCPTFKGVEAKVMHFGKLFSESGELLDECLMVSFENPHSFTGEDVAEIHCHGGRVVVDEILTTIFSYNGRGEVSVRHAAAGEFSHRAFLNGKMDITQAEGIADLISSETLEQKKQAMKQMQGELGQRFDLWREKIMYMLAHTEAAIDFPDEELDVLEESGLKGKLIDLLADLNLAVSVDAGYRLRDGFNVVIIGEPNAGKSTLTNLLTGKDTAIVSSIEGTTRDVLEAHLNVDGFPVVLADTAGIRETQDLIEREGVGRAQKKAQEADLIIAVSDGTKFPEISDKITSQFIPGRTLIVLSRADMFKLNDVVEYKGHPLVKADLRDLASLDLILNKLVDLIRAHFVQARSAAQLTRERHRQAVQLAIEHLERAQKLYENPHEAYSVSELLAQDFRDAAAAIGSVTGQTGTEDVLDLVFSTFCIGK